MHISQRAQRACLWRWTLTAPPSPCRASQRTTCCSGVLSLLWLVSHWQAARECEAKIACWSSTCQAALTLASKLWAAHNRPALHRPRTAPCRPHILVRGLMAHGVAEALLNAPQVRWVGLVLTHNAPGCTCLYGELPGQSESSLEHLFTCHTLAPPVTLQVLGSLSLLFNPTGLVRSVRAGVGDLIGLPLAALQNQSLSQASVEECPGTALGCTNGCYSSCVSHSAAAAVISRPPGWLSCVTSLSCRPPACSSLAAWGSALCPWSGTPWVGAAPMHPSQPACASEFQFLVHLASLPFSFQDRAWAGFKYSTNVVLTGCLRHPSEPCAGWTLTSISGFSQAFARAVDSAVAIRSTSAAGGAVGGSGGGAAALAHRPLPAHLGHGLSQGVASLAEGVAAGITGVVRAPIEVRSREWRGNGVRAERGENQFRPAELVRC